MRGASRRLGNKALRYNTALNGPSSPRVSSFNQRFCIASECTVLNKRDRLNYEDIWRTHGSHRSLNETTRVVEERLYIHIYRRSAICIPSEMMSPLPRRSFANSPTRNSRASRNYYFVYASGAPGAASLSGTLRRRLMSPDVHRRQAIWRHRETRRDVGYVIRYEERKRTIPLSRPPSADVILVVLRPA